MNVLLVGLGRWGEKHLRVLGELGVTTWAADVSAERRAWAASRGVDASRVVADYRDALAHVDALDIVTPADSAIPVSSTTAADVSSHDVSIPRTFMTREVSPRAGRPLPTALR